MKAISLLLTSAIDPSGISHCAVNSPEERYEECRQALRKWISSAPIQQIIFCDNTTYPIDELKAEVGSLLPSSKKIQFLQYDGQKFPRSLGKGYGEMLTMKYVELNSSIFQESDLVIKVNARYFVDNIEKIVSGISSMSSPAIVGNLSHNLTYMDSRVFAFQPHFFSEYFSPLHEKINDEGGLYFEHALARATHLALANGHRWEMLPVFPIISGKSGTTGKGYSGSSLKSNAKYIYHQVKKKIYQN